MNRKNCGNSPTVSVNEFHLRMVTNLAKTLRYLESRSTLKGDSPDVTCHRLRDSIDFLRLCGSEGDTSSIIEDRLIEVLYVVITQHVLPWMPKEYQSDSCSDHDHFCFCVTVYREQFVMNRLREMGVDIVKMKYEVDAAYIMSLEKQPVKPRLKRSIDKTPRQPELQRIPKECSPVCSKFEGESDQLLGVQNRVIVEFIPDLSHIHDNGVTAGFQAHSVGLAWQRKSWNYGYGGVVPYP